MSTTKHSTESDYEMAYRSTIQPRTAVRTQSRQSGGYSTGAVSGGGGIPLNLDIIIMHIA
ncbi:unnamed protein product [Gongylonema pulchrum]|uniref:Uncharacterized protein n=1 Tax=Gongylonema pulchrum TaxID=637853 RepID=A0A183DLQ3_9BILA|nr:unnamed protein product [Gongylonema pulchrum]